MGTKRKPIVESGGGKPPPRSRGRAPWTGRQRAKAENLLAFTQPKGKFAPFLLIRGK